MIIFQHNDLKIQSLINELHKIDVDSQPAIVKHPIFGPFFILKQIWKRNSIDVFVFRYLNDSDNFILSWIRYFSDLFLVFILKLIKADIWYLCHNIDCETTMFFPKTTKLRRDLVSNNAKIILTTNSLLIEKAKEVFPNKTIDYISLGYIKGGVLLTDSFDQKIEENLVNWISSKNDKNSKFIFCVGAPAKKAIHFTRVSNFVERINKGSKYNYYAIVIGDKVSSNSNIYNIPYKYKINESLLKKYADFYYRIIDDYSMSYSTYEAVEFRIPVITENYGILPDLIKKYNIGIVYDSLVNFDFQIENYILKEEDFQKFEIENNWAAAAKKIKTLL